MKRRSFIIIQLVLVLWLASSLVQADGPTKFSLTAGPIGAAGYSLGSWFVKVIQIYCPDMAITLESGAAVKNVRMIAQNPNVIGFTNLDLAYYDISGGPEFDKRLKGE